MLTAPAGAANAPAALKDRQRTTATTRTRGVINAPGCDSYLLLRWTPYNSGRVAVLPREIVVRGRRWLTAFPIAVELAEWQWRARYKAAVGGDRAVAPG